MIHFCRVFDTVLLGGGVVVKKLLLLLILFGCLSAKNLENIGVSILLQNDFMNSQETVQGIPANLLRAVSNVESGRWVGGMVTPWPWTINVEGRGYIFKTKAEAIQAVEKFQRKGAKSIDVGIMQINLLHHPEAFGNLHEAFDPQLNIAYGAKFLKQLFLQHKAWNKAVGHYHSATLKYHNAYRQRVMSQWVQLSKNCKVIKGSVPLAQTVIYFDDLTNIKAGPQTVLRSFAKVKKRVYCALTELIPNPKLENGSSRQFYSVD